MGINELILRYAAVSTTFNKQSKKMVNYDGRIKNMLNNYMKLNQNPSEDFLISFESDFCIQLNKAYSVFGNSAFKLDNSTRVNSSLYDCIMIAFKDYDLEKILKNKENIKKMTYELTKDIEFEKRITKATNNTEAFNFRINEYIEKLADVMKDAE